jgi:hypothetical protein
MCEVMSGAISEMGSSRERKGSPKSGLENNERHDYVTEATNHSTHCAYQHYCMRLDGFSGRCSPTLEVAVLLQRPLVGLARLAVLFEAVL